MEKTEKKHWIIRFLSLSQRGMRTEDFIRRFRSFLVLQFKLWHVGNIIYSSENIVCISEDAYVIKKSTSLTFTIPFLDLFFFIANVQLFHSLSPLTKMYAPWRQRPLLLLFTADPRILLLHHRWSAHFCQGMNLLCPHFRVTVRIRLKIMNVKGLCKLPTVMTMSFWSFIVQILNTLHHVTFKYHGKDKGLSKEDPLCSWYLFTTVKVEHIQWHNWKIQSIQWKENQPIHSLTILTLNHQLTN